MKIYLINLDRHPQRLARMETLLEGLPFQRLAAVDGCTMDGLENRDCPVSSENLSRYEICCVMSHRNVWSDFLAGTEKYACVFEDDLYFSPNFSRFLLDESWIPKDGRLVKLETSGYPVLLSRKTEKCLDRSAAVLFSIHYGTAAYIISREGAANLLARTQIINSPADFLVFDTTALRLNHPVYQLYPALCVQGTKLPNGIAFAEMQSAIQPAPVSKRKSRRQKFRLEITRPFLQLAAALNIFFKEKWLRARRDTVPFA